MFFTPLNKFVLILSQSLLIGNQDAKDRFPQANSHAGASLPTVKRECNG